MEFHHFSKLEKQQHYLNDMRPVLIKKALFSDTTEDYLTPCEPNTYARIRIRFRSARNNIDYVFFVCGQHREVMLKAHTDELFDYYECSYQLDDEAITWHFEIRSGKLVCYYDQRGVVKATDPQFEFKVIPGFRTPKWAKGAVMYQIFVDRFCNGDPENDVLDNEYIYLNARTQHARDWYQYPKAMDVYTFYGGDLQGVMNKLDYLQELGIDAIYFNPLFVSPSNHKYDIQDYDYIDPHIGKIVKDEGELLGEAEQDNRYAGKYINRVTNKENLEASNRLFIRLVEEAHKRGIKVIIDGVFNHCGSFNKWMDREQIYASQGGYEKGAYLEENSPYHSYFRFYDANRWPKNNSYDGWWGHTTLPKLNYEGSRELYDHMISIGKKWVSPPYNVDGWRLDVAADLGYSSETNYRFWRDFRAAVKEVNPEALILAEHYGNSSAWLQGDQWDTIMNYDAFMEPITWFLTGMQKHSDDYRADLHGNVQSFWDAMRYHTSYVTNSSLQVAMNELSNHDHSRFLTRTNHKVGRIGTLGPEAANENTNKAVLREAVVFQMTWVGAPTIYYGDEAGLCGFTDPDNRRTYPWGREDKELIAFHRSMIRIRKSNPELMTGSLKPVLSEYQVLGYGRMKGRDSCLILINNSGEEITRDISVWHLGVPMETVMQRLMLTTGESFTEEEQEYAVRSGKVQITLPGTSAIVLKYGGGGKRQGQKTQKVQKTQKTKKAKKTEAKKMKHFLLRLLERKNRKR